MYTTRHLLERRGLAIPAGFIHLPQSAAMVATSGLDQPSMDLPLTIRAIETALRVIIVDGGPEMAPQPPNARRVPGNP
jgi:pyrrolidone-carboxylate peptidase